MEIQRRFNLPALVRVGHQEQEIQALRPLLRPLGVQIRERGVAAQVLFGAGGVQQALHGFTDGVVGERAFHHDPAAAVLPGGHERLGHALAPGAARVEHPGQPVAGFQALPGDLPGLVLRRQPELEDRRVLAVLIQIVQRQHGHRRRAHAGQLGHVVLGQRPDHELRAVVHRLLEHRAHVRVADVVKTQVRGRVARFLGAVVAGHHAVADRLGGGRQRAALREQHGDPLGALAGGALQGPHRFRQLAGGRMVGPVLAPARQALHLAVDVGLRVAVQQRQLQPAAQLAGGVLGAGFQRLQRQAHQRFPGQLAVVFLVVVIEQRVHRHALAQAFHQLAVERLGVGAQQVQLGAALGVEAVDIAPVVVQQRHRPVRLLLGHPGLGAQLQPAEALIPGQGAVAHLVEQFAGVVGAFIDQVRTCPGQGGVGAHRFRQLGQLVAGVIDLLRRIAKGCRFLGGRAVRAR